MLMLMGNFDVVAEIEAAASSETKRQRRKWFVADDNRGGSGSVQGDGNL